MGVPGFFRELCKKSQGLLLKAPSENVDNLYFDYNCLLHPQFFETLKLNQDENDPDTLFDLIFENIIKKTMLIIEHCKPRKMIYIAVDGVAPEAKIKQQRERRMGSNDYKNVITKKHNIKQNTTYENIVFTPGTEFMYKLHKRLKETFLTYPGVDIIYSSYLVPSEGEHKILDHIRTKCSPKTVSVIYSNDADLVFLALTRHNRRIFVLRDEEKSLLYVDNVSVSNNVNKIMSGGSCSDFITLCALLGNDFVPKIPSTDTFFKGLDKLLQAYRETKQHSTSLFNKKINFSFLEKILVELGNQEQEYFSVELPKLIQQKRKRHNHSLRGYDRDIWLVETLRAEVVDGKLCHMKIHDNVKLGVGKPREWKRRYYQHYFGDVDVDDICKHYLEGLSWMTEYYFVSCPSWTWKYKYTHAPFASDLGNYLHKMKKCLDITFVESKPWDVFTQLAAVIPRRHKDLLPKQLREISAPSSPLYQFYPSEFSIDKINNVALYRCVPNIPVIDMKQVDAFVKKAKLTKQERKRCKPGSVYHFF